MINTTKRTKSESTDIPWMEHLKGSPNLNKTSIDGTSFKNLEMN